MLFARKGVFLVLACWKLQRIVKNYALFNRVASLIFGKHNADYPLAIRIL